VKLPLFNRETSLTLPAVIAVSLSDLGGFESEQTRTTYIGVGPTMCNVIAWEQNNIAFERNDIYNSMSLCGLGNMYIVDVELLLL